MEETDSYQPIINWKGLVYLGLCSLCLKLCPTLCYPMDCSTPGFPVLNPLLELAQSHVHWVSDAIQPAHPLSPPSPPALNLSQHQGLFQWLLFSSGDQSIGASASVLPMNIQGWFPLGLTGWISLLSKELSKVFSSATIGKPQFFSAQPSLWSNSHICTWLLENPQLWLDGPLSAKWCLCFSCSLYSLGQEISYSTGGREPYHLSSWHWVKQWIEPVKQVKWVCKSISLLLVIVVECKLCGYICVCVCVCVCLEWV